MRNVVDYFDFVMRREARRLTGEGRVLSGARADWGSIPFEPVDVSAMQGLVVGLPTVEEARMLLALFGEKEVSHG